MLQCPLPSSIILKYPDRELTLIIRIIHMQSIQALLRVPDEANIGRVLNTERHPNLVPCLPLCVHCDN
uniref:Uncharacterized protein n=1 Tax=Triticum urartu TaxID=4572 RepID=A0A8R7K3V2_TRIUA